MNNIVQGDTWSIDDVEDNTGVKCTTRLCDWEINCVTIQMINYLHVITI